MGVDKLTFKSLIIFMVLFGSSWCGVIRHSARTTEEQTAYLRRYGYLSSSSPMYAAVVSGNSREMVNAIKRFQRMVGIPVTGRMNAQTIEMMEKPRCGVVDYERGSTGTRTKRYAMADYKWSTNRLTYKIQHYTNDLPRSSVRRIFQKSFKKWSDETNMSFYERSWLPADIDIVFAAGQHCRESDHGFDGRGGTLAHAFFPLYGGDMHFDEDEQWAENPRQGVNLLEVAVHEIGHALGLHHSENQHAIMAPIYKGLDDEIELHSDDKAGIRALYGSKRG